MFLSRSRCTCTLRLHLLYASTSHYAYHLSGCSVLLQAPAPDVSEAAAEATADASESASEPQADVLDLACAAADAPALRAPAQSMPTPPAVNFGEVPAPPVEDHGASEPLRNDGAAGEAALEPPAPPVACRDGSMQPHAEVGQHDVNGVELPAARDASKGAAGSEVAVVAAGFGVDDIQTTTGIAEVWQMLPAGSSDGMAVHVRSCSAESQDWQCSS